MKKTLAKLHRNTDNSLAVEYELRVETYRSVTQHALMPFIKALSEGYKVIDVGCAVGYTVEILQQFKMVAEGIDIAPAMISYARLRNPHTKFIP